MDRISNDAQKVSRTEKKGEKVKMRKTSAMVLALMMVLSLAGCGEKTTPPETATEPTAESTTLEPTEESSAPTLYKKGDTVSTESMQCTVVSVNKINDESDGTVHIKAVYKVKNIGKTAITRDIRAEDGGTTNKLIELVALDYNNGFVFTPESDFSAGSSSSYYKYNQGSLGDLKVLGDEEEIEAHFRVPSEVWDNREAPLLLRVALWSSEAKRNTAYFLFRLR